ncbi:MAG: MFS transporter [Rhodospirillaceae bacterium]|jgi:MFS family permease|nr:MFS transporter [Rhodospirillaceae bacterium]MBT6117505.1 MFS transporter [Rhodospirillaceae bacterium]
MSVASSEIVPLWRRPMVIITAGCLIALITFGVRAGFGVFLAPISADLGWGREVFAFAIAIQNLVWGAAQPVAGAIADRYGSGRVLAVGGLLYAAGIYLMSVSTSPFEMQMSAGVLVGLGLAGASFAVVLAAIGRAVSPERRSLALGIGTAAGSLGQFLLVPVGQALLAEYGWTMALVLLSVLSLAVVPLASALTGRSKAGAGEVDQALGAALREAGGHSSYMYLTAGFFVCGFQVVFIAIHLPAYITDIGLSAELGGYALALVGLFNVIGSFAAGFFGGRFSKKYLLTGIYLARSAVIAAFVLAPPSAAAVLLFSAAIGLLWLSTVPLTSGLVAQFFGVRYMATLFGIVFFSHQIGSFLGVWLGGYLFDATGSYDVVWWINVALGLGAGLLHLPIVERGVPRLAGAS